MIAVVIKSFNSQGVTQTPGSLVDTADWRNEQRMLQARQIRPASASELASYEKGARNIHAPKSDVTKPRAKSAA